jgi:LysR family hydrogen peroxide-inducible transcriptional activator
MTLQQLEYVLAVDKYRHFAKAAASCGVQQSTLSTLIKKLEEELDTVIFNRDSHPVEPTELGQAIIDQARVTLYNATQLSDLVAHAREETAGELRLAVISTVAPVLLPGLYSYFGEKHPEVFLHSYEMLSSTILTKLRLAEIDMAVLSEPVPTAGLLAMPLYSERFFAFISPSEPAFSKKELDREDIFSSTLWVLKDGIMPFRNDPAQTEYDYTEFYEGGRVDVLLRIVEMSHGIAIIPENIIPLLSPERQRCVRPIRSGRENKRTLSLVVRQDYVKERLVNQVLDGIRTIIRPDLYEWALKQVRVRL